MNCTYEDIRNRIAEPPKWWDEQAVPRYEAFHPRWISNIYAKEAALVHITCQACGHEFQVCVSSGLIEEIARHQKAKAVYLYEQITAGAIHYGDPPNIECCSAGTSMNCIDQRVLEYWKREKNEWVRDPRFELVLPE